MTDYTKMTVDELSNLLTDEYDSQEHRAQEVKP